jgi:NADH-quinone oxidoreductase subunit C
MEDRRAGMGIESHSPGNPESSRAADLLRELVPDAIAAISFPQGDATVAICRDRLKSVMEFLKCDDRLKFNLLIDLTAVDYLGEKPRFEIVYHLLSLPRNERIRIKLRVDESDPVVESVSSLWASANWLEREVWDMFGIRFAGHPDLKRILMYDDFEGHPLRKDYPLRKRQPRIGPRS